MINVFRLQIVPYVPVPPGCLGKSPVPLSTLEQEARGQNVVLVAKFRAGHSFLSIGRCSVGGGACPLFCSGAFVVLFPSWWTGKKPGLGTEMWTWVLTVCPTGCVTSPSSVFPLAEWRHQSCHGKALWELGSKHRAGTSGFGGRLCALNKNGMGPSTSTCSHAHRGGIMGCHLAPSSCLSLSPGQSLWVSKMLPFLSSSLGTHDRPST